MAIINPYEEVGDLDTVGGWGGLERRCREG